MGKILLLTFMAVLLTFCSCKKETKQEDKQKALACFDYTPKIDLTVNTEISFSNCSQNAISYAWNFGDGKTSIDKDTKHTFSSAGTYKVLLMAQNDKLIDINADGLIDWRDVTVTSDTISVKVIIK
jgi:hypothetical protein